MVRKAQMICFEEGIVRDVVGMGIGEELEM